MENNITLFAKYVRTSALIYLYAIAATVFLWLVGGLSEMFLIGMMLLYAVFALQILAAAWREGPVPILLSIIATGSVGLILFMSLKGGMYQLSSHGWNGGYVMRWVT